MQEAIALRRRVEFAVPGESEAIVAGLRDGGELATYFGMDPVFQFDALRGLRRAFVDGLLYRTQGATLAQLRTERTASSTELVRHDLDANELRIFMANMCERLHNLHSAIADGRAKIARQVPEDDNRIVSDVLAAIDGVLASDTGLSPEIRGKH
jgi:hypothetical protein